MEYWAIINQKQEGPLTLDELMALDISDDTPVWHMGLDGWVLASDVPEVAQRLKSNFIAETPMVLEPSPVVTPAEKCPPTYLVWAILSAIFCCIPFGIPAIYMRRRFQHSIVMEIMKKPETAPKRQQCG